MALGLLLTVPLYVGLAKSGVIRSPFFPRADGDLALARSDRAGLRVLFVGNSFTYYNEMPSMVHRLAESDPGAPPLFVVEYTAPNWSLKKASTNGGLLNLIGEVRWDSVVLQERSWALSSPDYGERETYPAALLLSREIRVAGAETVFFLTWGYKHGDPTRPGDSFDAMQVRLSSGYEDLVAALDARVAPVGPAWAEALRRRPGLELWTHGGGHPNKLGSYLAACVFYGTLTGQDPSRSTFTGGLDPADAHFLQDVAADVVERLQGAA
ncbi:MAG TPA: hypothetical protein VGJ34_03050 [Gaiellaceae bacterium]